MLRLSAPGSEFFLAILAVRDETLLTMRQASSSVSTFVNVRIVRPLSRIDVRKRLAISINHLSPSGIFSTVMVVSPAFL